MSRNTNSFISKIKHNPVSAVVQLIVVICFVAVPVLVIAYENNLSPWYRWIVFSIGVVFAVVQLIRLKCPLLMIDRIFASRPRKQIILALFAFIVTLDIALVLFPDSGIRYAVADIVSTVKLSHQPEEIFEMQTNNTNSNGTHNFSEYKVITKPVKPIRRWEYTRHSIIYFLGLIVFNGLLIATINRVMATRAEQYKKGQNTYRRLRNQYLIVGFGTSCIPIIRNLSGRQGASPSDFFLILSNQDTEKIRRIIQTQLPHLEEQVVIYSGDINEKPHLERLNIGRAKEVFVIGEGKEPGRDSLNLECAKAIKDIRANNARKNTGILQVNVQFDRPASYSTIKKVSLPQSYFEDDRHREIIYLHPFNFYENWARLLWGTFQLEGYKTLDRGQMVEDNVKDEPMLTDKHVHLVIAGFGNTGVALLLEALRICHYPNYNEKTGSNKTVITVVDPKMDELLPRFKSQYPYLDQISDIEMNFVSGNIEDDGNRLLLQELSLREDVLLTVAICFYDPDYSLAAALCLPEALFYTINEGKVIPNNTTQILVRQEIEMGLASLLDNKNGKYSNVKLFGTLDKGVDDTLLDDKMPVFIGAYYHFKYDVGKDFFEEVENDASKAISEAARHWIALNEDMRFSNRYQVEMYKTYKTYRKYFQRNPEVLYQMEHLRWCAERSITGYRDAHEQGVKYTQDDFQIHKLIVPYGKLPTHEKLKDRDVLEIMDKVIKLSKEAKDFKITQTSTSA